jgi:hypothetical protein
MSSRNTSCVQIFFIGGLLQSLPPGTILGWFSRIIGDASGHWRQLAAEFWANLTGNEIDN